MDSKKTLHGIVKKRVGTIFFIIFIIIFFIIVIIILILPFSMLPFGRLCLEASLGLSRYLTNAIGIRGAPAGQKNSHHGTSHGSLLG